MRARLTCLRSFRIPSLCSSVQRNAPSRSTEPTLSHMASSEDPSNLLDNAGIRPLHVPGFGLPIDFCIDGNQLGLDLGDDSTCFRHGVNDFHADRLTVRELAMIKFMASVTEKTDWNVKVFDENIVKKWGEEVMSRPTDLMSEKTLQWCTLELRDAAEQFEKVRYVKTLEGGSRCVKGDTLIPSTLMQQLKKAMKPLLDVKPDNRDYHPNSNDQVLNFVHPSLYPLIYGRARVLNTGQVGLLNCMDSCGLGETSKEGQDVAATKPGNSRMEIENTGLWSRRFQWLPCEVKFQGENEVDVKITSYINNLHPGLHKELYSIIETLIAKSIPLWNEVLIQDELARVPPRIQTNRAETQPESIPDWADEEVYYVKSEDEAKNAAAIAKVREYLALPENPLYEPNPTDDPFPENWEDWEEYSDWDLSKVIKWKFDRIRKVIHPEPAASLSYEDWKRGIDPYPVKLEERFRTQGLQVIIKIASVELTPDKPVYPGGSWHLEGMTNEHIVATAIYYYDVENISVSHLRFRQEATLDEMGLEYEQDEHEPLSIIFGTQSMRDEPAVQELGRIETRSGRLLVFPNTLQHKVEPFELLDPQKPGHRRFVVLWLVDPHYRIVSTANVPPQQAEWNGVMTEGWNRDLPQEVSDMVQEYALRGQMSLEDAKAARLELMAERTVFQDTVEDNFDEYNLCEH